MASWPRTPGSASRTSKSSPTPSSARRTIPTLGRGYLECAYAPMVELLGYLDANGFANYIVSGGGRDFMRPISQDMYGIPRERVIGSSSTFAYTSNDKRRHHHPQARGRLPRRRPGEASADLEPHRPAPAARGRKLQRRRPDARIHPPHRQAHIAPPSSFTTTPSASSTTPPAPSRHSAEPRRTDGPSSASRTTGPPSFDLDATGERQGPPRRGHAIRQARLHVPRNRRRRLDQDLAA